MAITNDVVRHLYDSGVRDLDLITRTVLTKVLASDDAVSELHPVMYAHVSRMLRGMVRSLERSADLRPTTENWVNPATAARDKLLREAVWVPGYGRVAWGQLTIPQHKLVMDHYRITVRGYEMTISKHQQAISIITAHPGAVCLDDIKDEPVSKQSARK